MKAIRPLLLVDYVLMGKGTEDDIARNKLVVALPDGTPLFEHDVMADSWEAYPAAFERLTACEAVEP